MENKYLEKIASWQEPPKNRYLEKVASILSTLGNWAGNFKAIPRGGGAAGSLFNTIDRGVGGAMRTVQKAFRPTLPTDIKGVGGQQIYAKNVKADLGRGRMGLAKGPGQMTAAPKMTDTQKLQMAADRKAKFQDLRERTGRVKDPTRTTTVNDGTGISKRTAGYKTPGVKFDPNAQNKYLAQANKTIEKNKLVNQGTTTARMKVGLGAAGLVGVAGLGYHMGKGGNQPQQPDYGNMPY